MDRADWLAAHPVAYPADREATIPAPTTLLWDLVADVTLIGSMSPECIGAEWLTGEDGPRAGGRFRGRNRSAEGTLVAAYGMSADPAEAQLEVVDEGVQGGSLLARYRRCCTCSSKWCRSVPSDGLPEGPSPLARAKGLPSPARG